MTAAMGMVDIRHGIVTAVAALTLRAAVVAVVAAAATAAAVRVIVRVGHIFRDWLFFFRPRREASRLLLWLEADVAEE